MKLGQFRYRKKYIFIFTAKTVQFVDWSFSVILVIPSTKDLNLCLVLTILNVIFHLQQKDRFDS